MTPPEYPSHFVRSATAGVGITPAFCSVAGVRAKPFCRRSKIHGLDIRVSWPIRTFPPSFCPTARPIAVMVVAFRGNSPAYVRMPSVPNNFVPMRMTVAEGRLLLTPDFYLYVHRGRLFETYLRIRGIKIGWLFE